MGKSLPRVLVVEDNRRHAELITDELRESSLAAEVDWAATGKQGFEKLSSETVDLIVLDYRLPDTDGLEFMRELRERGGSSRARSAGRRST